MYEGVFPAIVTPFNEDESVDYRSLDKLVDFLLDSGVNGLVTCGTTGESSTLTQEERTLINRRVAGQVNGRVPVIAGVGTNVTATTIQYAHDAVAAGVDALLVITPYYNKPTPRGLYLHFTKVADAVSLPVILYNVPSRTGINIDRETVAKLSQHPRIAGLKEASGSLDQITSFLEDCGKTFCILSGDDALNYPILCIGGKGAISVSANIIPDKMTRMFQCHKNGDADTASALNREMYPINKALFIETNPIPVKTALALMGIIKPVFRLPMTPMSDQNRKILKQVLVKHGVIK